MNQLTTTPVQPLTLCHMPKGERPIDIAIWYFSDANGDVWAAPSQLGLVARTYNNRSRAIKEVRAHGYVYRIFGENRFATPEALKAAAEKQAAADLARRLPMRIDPKTGEGYQSDLNPYATPGARNDWQRGFDNAPPYSWETQEREWDFQFQLGRAARKLLDEHNTKTKEN